MESGKKSSAAGMAGIGLGVAALAAAAAGAYFLYGKDGAKNRKKVRAWSLKMRGDVLEKVEKLKEVSEDSYNMVIDEVSARYAGLKNIDLSELEALTKDLKKHWKNIKRDIASSTKPTKKKPASK